MITAVIPNWNGGERLRRVVSDLAAQTLPPERILVIDNASTDDSTANLAAEIIRLDRNTGFTGAVNRGIAECSTPLVAILNNDLELPRDWLAALASSLETDTQAWFATGKILQARSRDMIDATFDAVAASRCPWRCGSGRQNSSIWDTPHPIHSAPLTAALFRRELFERTGPLDERFGSYLEDVDLGIRCRLQDLKGLYLPAAMCYHWGSATLGVWHAETVRLQSRNQVFLLAKYPPRSWISGTGWKILAGQLLWGVVAARHHRLLSWLEGKWQGLWECRHFRVASVDSNRLEVLFGEDEKQIRALQEASGYDRYWKFYFALT